MLLKTLEIYSPSVQFYCKPGATSLVTLPYSWRLLHHGKVRMWIMSHKRVPMGRAPYESAKEGGWALFCFHIEPQKSTNVIFTATQCPRGLPIMYKGTTSAFEVESWQHTTLWTTCHMCDHGVASRARSHQLCSSTQSNLVITFSEVKSKVSYLRYAWHSRLCFSDSTNTFIPFSHAKFVPRWSCIWVNFDPIH